MKYQYLMLMSSLAWRDHTALTWLMIAAYLVLLGLVGIYGLHRYWLVYLYLRYGGRVQRAPERFDRLPHVTVQLPMYNEASVAERMIDAACRLEYPPDQLQIQVVDDSTDHCAEVARRRTDYWAARGVDIQYLHRARRTGYKAGALEDAMTRATGEFVAIFDADFVPPRDFLQRTIHHFTDPTVGMVQTRWDHMNRDYSLLTRCQALFLDAHFIVEHTARNRSGRWMHFNGTAGIWRTRAIDSAGGWQHDTLTEDLDLSYRSQLAGWRFVYVPELACPAELPPEMDGFKAQQHRWTKGTIQTARKILPVLLRSKIPLRVKIEAFFHLTCPMVYVFVTLVVALFFPVIVSQLKPFEDDTWTAMILVAGCFSLGSVSVAVFNLVSQRALGRSMATTLLYTPALMGLGVGIALNNACACIEALIGHESPFVRTPKYNLNGRGARNGAATGREHKSGIAGQVCLSKLWMPTVEISMGIYTLICAALAIGSNRSIVGVTFLLIFSSGYLYVGFSGLWIRWQSHRASRALVLQPSS